MRFRQGVIILWYHGEIMSHLKLVSGDHTEWHILLTNKMICVPTMWISARASPRMLSRFHVLEERHIHTWLGLYSIHFNVVKFAIIVSRPPSQCQSNLQIPPCVPTPSSLPTNTTTTHRQYTAIARPQTKTQTPKTTKFYLEPEVVMISGNMIGTFCSKRRNEISYY